MSAKDLIFKLVADLFQKSGEKRLTTYLIFMERHETYYIIYQIFSTR